VVAVNELALFAGASLGAMTCSIAISVHRIKMGEWTKSTDTAKSENVPSAANSSVQGTREASSNVARMRAVASCKREKRFAPAPYVARNSCRQDQAMRRAPAPAEPLSGCRAENLTQWSKCETDSPCFAALSLRDACGTKRIEPRRFSGIRSRSCALTLKPISRLECHGATTAREAKNGA